MRGDLGHVEAQTAFVGLLARPVVTSESDADLHRLVRRHQRTLTGWAARCGYRLVVIGEAARLHRPPIGGEVAHPAFGSPPSRRQLVLTLAAAAVCEEGESTTTLQAISDGVRVISAMTASSITAYDPDSRAERFQLVRALERLEWFGVLRRRTHDEQLLRSWEEARQGVGRGYAVDRSALLQLVDPAAVAAAFSEPDEQARSAGTSQRLLRRLLETQALLLADLDDGETEWLRSRRGRLADEAARMTGGSVEQRAEGMLLILPSDRPVGGAGTVDWPAPTTASSSATQLADAVMAQVQGTRTSSTADQVDGLEDEGIDPDGVRFVSSRTIEALAGDLYDRHQRHLTKDLRGHPERVRATAEAVLRDAGLLRTTETGDWRLMPTAARYRNPQVVDTGQEVGS